MALLNPGFWPETYWPSNYWDPNYWPKYGAPSAPTAPGVGIAPVKRLKRRAELPLPLELAELLIDYLRAKLGE